MKRIFTAFKICMPLVLIFLVSILSAQDEQVPAFIKNDLSGPRFS